MVRSTQFTVALRDALGTPPPDAVAVRCWPEFFNEYKAAACSTLSHLIEDGIPAACEADTLGAVTMLMQQLLTGQHTYLGDLVHVDDQRNTCTFWHCGVGAFSLASPKTGPVAGVQPNRNLGFALNHSLKAGPVTIARLGQGPDGLRLGLLCGEAVDGPNTFTGTSVEVRMQRPVRETPGGDALRRVRTPLFAGLARCAAGTRGAVPTAVHSVRDLLRGAGRGRQERRYHRSRDVGYGFHGSGP